MSVCISHIIRLDQTRQYTTCPFCSCDKHEAYEAGLCPPHTWLVSDQVKVGGRLCEECLSHLPCRNDGHVYRCACTWGTAVGDGQVRPNEGRQSRIVLQEAPWHFNWSACYPVMTFSQTVYRGKPPRQSQYGSLSELSKNEIQFNKVPLNWMYHSIVFSEG